MCGVDWSGSEEVQMESYFEWGNELPGSIKCCETLGWLQSLWPLE
jgi:hypothetical protein